MQLMGHSQWLMAQREFCLRHSAYTTTHVDNDHNHVFSPLGNSQSTSDLLRFSWITFLHILSVFGIFHTHAPYTLIQSPMYKMEKPCCYETMNKPFKCAADNHLPCEAAGFARSADQETSILPAIKLCSCGGTTLIRPMRNYWQLLVKQL